MHKQSEAKLVEVITEALIKYNHTDGLGTPMSRKQRDDYVGHAKAVAEAIYSRNNRDMMYSVIEDLRLLGIHEHDTKAA